MYLFLSFLGTHIIIFHHITNLVTFLNIKSSRGECCLGQSHF